MTLDRIKTLKSMAGNLYGAVAQLLPKQGRPKNADDGEEMSEVRGDEEGE